MDTQTNYHHRNNAVQVHYPQKQKLKQRQQQQSEDGINSMNTAPMCRYYYDSSSPTFPDLTPPLDMPTPHKTMSYRNHQHKNHDILTFLSKKPILSNCQKNHNKPQPQQLPQQQQLQPHQQFSDDPDTIEFCLDNEIPPSARYKEYGGRTQRYQHHQRTYDPQVRWSRNNIAATMERFQPMASPSSQSETSSCNSHQDYSYAYYEPGAIMCHSNIPTPDEVAGPSAPPPSSRSIRALLLKTKERTRETFPTNRHTYTTRYGTHENIYEDVSDDSQSRLVSSEQSLTDRGCAKKEFQHILSNHYRVLEELNLDVEEMLMSASPPTDPTPITPAAIVTIPAPQMTVKRMPALQSCVVDTLGTQLSALDIKDDMKSPVSEFVLGEDSGFSGSSSGASYIGSLRNYKTAITRSLRRSSAPSCSTSGTVYGSCRTAKCPSTHGQGNVRHGGFYNKETVNPDQSSTCNEPTQKSLKFSLWNRRS